MSKTIQRAAIILLLLGNSLCHAQQIPAEKKILLTANLQLQKGSPYYNPEEALKSYNLLAEKGNPEAMNALGLIYIKGITLVANEEKGILWLEKAAEAGYAQAWFNLGLLYKEGVSVKGDITKAIDCFKKAATSGYDYAWQKLGTILMKGENVPQDYLQALNIFKEGAEKGNSGCNYSLGYMYYKGLGCTQDYDKAIKQFELGSQKNNPAAMYMLGLCYRNGYGTSIDSDKATYWLNKSAARGFKPADIELANPEAENINPSKSKTISIPISEVITITESEVPESFKKVKQTPIETNISGNYTGQLLRYDWSGQNIISKTSLQIDLKQTGNKISGEWKEEDGDNTSFTALIQENAITFQDSKIDRIDHFHKNIPTTYEFKEAKLQLLETPESLFLVGNLNLYNVKEKENEKPIFLILERKQAKNTTEELEIVSKVVVYPNPFTNSFELGFNLAKNADVTASIHSLTGRLLYTTQWNNLEKGPQIKQIVLNAPSGNYILRINYGNEVKTSILIKK
ncbi:T9SS type A sorting domain-containing protein [Flavobacterium flavigenum]|uniref:T9SS type A sorting domain-containing protein n=1 Tax=Flavobacterium flavigenum TaxID=3003258 RepID=UPI0024821649|nr:T9SS type A sorting domain-containing protein [Flavobacterium flavigenum]